MYIKHSTSNTKLYDGICDSYFPQANFLKILIGSGASEFYKIICTFSTKKNHHQRLTKVILFTGKKTKILSPLSINTEIIQYNLIIIINYYDIKHTYMYYYLHQANQACESSQV